MAWFHRRTFGRAASSRTGQVLVLAASGATLVGLSVLVTGGSAESPSSSAAAEKRFVRVCTQRRGPNESRGDLNVRLRAFCAKGQKPLKLALWPAGRGPQGPPGPEGPQGPPGNAANAEFGVANVFVSRGGARRSRFATYSVSLGSPAGSTTSGQFRFTCTPAQAPCKVSFGAAVISTRSGKATLFPRILIHRQADLPNAPITYCEYADGANNNLGVNRIPRVPSLRAATREMRTPLGMGIGGSLDCGAGQPYSGTVKEIWVPAASAADSAFYDVSVTLQFK
jgi:hypothetical protein